MQSSKFQFKIQNSLKTLPFTLYPLRSLKGFTLIELLVVIAVLGVLAAGVLTAIDPVDKINAANDARGQTAIAEEGGAAEAYATSHSGFYPATVAEMVTAGELKIAPTAPTGYTYTFTAAPAACTGGTTCTSVVLTSTLKAKRWAAVPFQRYESSTGKTCQVVTATTVCP